MKAKRGALVVIVLLGIVSSTGVLAGCHATFSTPSGLREHHRGINGGLSVAKSKNDGVELYHETQKATDRTSLELLQLQLQGEK